jgi:hypothetical protein
MRDAKQNLTKNKSSSQTKIRLSLEAQGTLAQDYGAYQLFKLVNHQPNLNKTATNHLAIMPIKHKTYSPELIKFLHATAFSPTKTTWLQAIRKGFFQSWPG